MSRKEDDKQGSRRVRSLVGKERSILRFAQPYRDPAQTAYEQAETILDVNPFAGDAEEPDLEAQLLLEAAREELE